MTTSTSPELTARRLEVLRLVAEGFTDRQIARTLLISINSVKTRNQELSRALGTGDRAGKVAAGYRLGLLRRPVTVTVGHGRPHLDERALTVLDLIAREAPNWQIAARLRLGRTQAAVVIRSIYDELGSANKAHAVHLAVQAGYPIPACDPAGAAP